MHRPHLIAHLATFPPRAALLRANIVRLRELFPRVTVCLNGYAAVPEFLRGDDGIDAFIPDTDLKDTGKFARAGDGAGLHFLVDDDIVYPRDYVARMTAHAGALRTPAVLGVHGVVYRPWFFGGRHGRRVLHFAAALAASEPVDALGTGTVVVSGDLLPPFALMRDAAGFVDVRFARHCAERGVPRLCVPREAGWLQPCDGGGPSLYDAVTRWPQAAVFADVRRIRALGRAGTPRG